MGPMRRGAGRADVVTPFALGRISGRAGGDTPDAPAPDGGLQSAPRHAGHGPWAMGHSGHGPETRARRKQVFIIFGVSKDGFHHLSNVNAYQVFLFARPNVA